ncbi:MAG: hypothetical protein OJF49_003457 [Ktedonobacterales bacterium]|jgi:hypothetical protein|nr:MAG: hypothetical protein OJF49_003457 [Ktedonobacterales bacterium]
MFETQIRRFTATAGIISVVLYVVSAALISDLPSINDSAGTWSSYTASHGPQFLAEVYIWGATTAAVICFLTGLWSALRHAGRASDLLATLGLGAGLMIWAIVLAGFAPLLVLGYRAGSLDSASVKSLADLTLLGATLSAFPTAVSVGAFSVLILRTHALARWTGWFGFLVVVAHLAAAGAFAQDGFFSPSMVSVFVAPPLYFLWTLIISVAVLRRPHASRASAPSDKGASAPVAN